MHVNVVSCECTNTTTYIFQSFTVTTMWTHGNKAILSDLIIISIHSLWCDGRLSYPNPRLAVWLPGCADSSSFTYRYCILWTHIQVHSSVVYHCVSGVVNVSIHSHVRLQLPLMSVVPEYIYPFIFFTLVWWSLGLPKTSIAVYCYLWWVLSMNVSIRSFSVVSSYIFT